MAEMKFKLAIWVARENGKMAGAVLKQNENMWWFRWGYSEFRIHVSPGNVGRNNSGDDGGGGGHNWLCTTVIYSGFLALYGKGGEKKGPLLPLSAPLLDLMHQTGILMRLPNFGSWAAVVATRAPLVENFDSWLFVRGAPPAEIQS